MSKQYVKKFKIGTKVYFKDKAMKIRHREDGPAVEFYNGDRVWYLNDKRHRLDGPAIEYTDSGGYWYINDVFIFQTDLQGNIVEKMYD